MSIVLVGSTSGSITLQEPAVAGTTVLTLPAVTGNVLTDTSPKVGNVIQVVSAAKIDTFSESVASGATSGDVTGLTASITPSSTITLTGTPTQSLTGSTTPSLLPLPQPVLTNYNIPQKDDILLYVTVIVPILGLIICICCIGACLFRRRKQTKESELKLRVPDKKIEGVNPA